MPAIGSRRTRRWRPRWTIRLRLTLLYGGLFLVAGAALLGVTYGLVANGAPRDQAFFVSRINGAGTAQFTFTLGNPGNAKLGPPAKLIFFSWHTLQHQVAFEFKDLPLP